MDFAGVLLSSDEHILPGEEIPQKCLNLGEAVVHWRWTSAPTSRVLIGGQICASEINSGERMLARGGCVASGRTPAKPPWSEVIVLLNLLLWQK